VGNETVQDSILDVVNYMILLQGLLEDKELKALLENKETK
jgi:hypothetical protein